MQKNDLLQNIKKRLNVGDSVYHLVKEVTSLTSGECMMSLSTTSPSMAISVLR